ncbi:MAG TPA: hypothetical protein VM597_06880 [Gemmataceae bacterium]|nr:hypothetical protein [Gemmataceae bacterium]
MAFRPSARPVRRPRLTCEPLETRDIPSVTTDFAFGLTGPTGAARAVRSLSDTAGNGCAIGTFTGTVDFDPSANTSTLTAFTNPNDSSRDTTFVAKYDPDGNFQWAQRAGGGQVADAAVDADGSVYLVGNFSGTHTFGSTPLTAAGYEDAFVAKVDGTGAVAWAVQAGGTSGGSEDAGRGLAIDGQGNVFISGSFGVAATFGTLPPVTSGTAWPAGFAARINPTDGTFVWAKATRFLAGSGQTGVSPDGIGVDGDGRVTISGGYYGSFDFDPGAGTTTLTSAKRAGGYASSDIFLWQLGAADGAFRWARTIGGNGRDGGGDLSVDAAGNIYSVGGFEGNQDFDPGKGRYTLSGGGRYLLKLSAAGNFIWARGGAGVAVGEQIALDATGIYMTGTLSGTADFDPGPGAASRTSAGGTDAYVLKLDTNGNYVWVVTAGGAGDDRGVSVAVDGSGNVWAVGGFTGTADFDPGAGELLLSAPTTGSFVWKLAQP